MKKLRVLIVDDEYLAMNIIENFLQHLEEFEIVAKVKSPITALNMLQEQAIDLLFLDIQMPTLSGNQLLRSLKHPPVTIFTTAYTDYAIEAYDLNVVDYLLKPFSFERFLQAIQKAKEQLNSAQPPAPTLPDAPVPAPAGKDFFSVKVDGKVQKIKFDEILFIEGLKEYVRIVCQAGKYVTLESLRNLEDILPAGKFLRVHKSYIVAIGKVNALNGNMLEIGPVKIPVSRDKKEEVLKAVF